MKHNLDHFTYLKKNGRLNTYFQPVERHIHVCVRQISLLSVSCVLAAIKSLLQKLFPSSILSLPAKGTGVLICHYLLSLPGGGRKRFVARLRAHSEQGERYSASGAGALGTKGGFGSHVSGDEAGSTFNNKVYERHPLNYNATKCSNVLSIYIPLEQA